MALTGIRKISEDSPATRDDAAVGWWLHGRASDQRHRPGRVRALNTAADSVSSC